METPIFRTERFVIRAFELKDLEAFALYRAQPEVAKYQSWSDYTLADAQGLWEKADYSNFGVVGHWYQLAIAERDSDEIVGDLALHFVDEEQMEMGFTIASQFQGQGVATEALSRVLSYLFNDLKKHRIVATTDAENLASYRLLEKVGFRREAHFIKNIFFKGAWGDEYQYALLSSEFDS